MKFNIITFGCKVNQYESNMMEENMLSSNFFYEENKDLLYGGIIDNYYSVGLVIDWNAIS